jgi:two-component system chemotaxis response regulator CheB
VRKSALTSQKRLRRHGRATPAKDGCHIENLIVIGASAGGHQVLVEILKDFSVNMPAAIVILLHGSLGSPVSFKASLQRFCRLPVIDVKSDEPLKQSVIFIPPPGRSATFSDGRIVTVNSGIPNRPANTINHMFTSAAQSYGEHVIGVILSGLLSDGTEGLRAVHEAGGLTMVQNPQEAEYPDMPTNAMEGLPVTFCLNLADIGPALELLVRRTSQFETGLAVALRMLRDRSALLVRLGEQSWRNPGTRAFVRHELASLRRNLQAIDDLVKASLTEHSG